MRRCGFCCCLFGLLLAHSLSAADDVAKPVDPDHAAKMARGLELFRQEVRNVLSDKCVKCHSGDDPQGALDLSTREGLLKGGERGPAAITGRGDKSLLVQLVTRRQEPFMPEEGEPLTKDQIATLVKWIDLGAPYDQPLGPPRANTAAWTERELDAQARQFWSFRPLSHASVPTAQDRQWCRTPVDYFVRSAQERASIAPQPEADRRTLIRRLSFDLLGLPPTRDDVEAFANDTSPEAYDRLVDRLLANPHLGERWGRHWLDLARFAESHGFEHDTDRPTAFHYRDFVIQALNANVPYDDFARWQIAGDELAPDNRLALMATGFLAAGVHSTQITKNEVERHRYDELDDMLATTGQAMLGLSLGCARCHDHKFDPIPQADYYRLLSAFTTTVRSEMDLDFDPEGYARAKRDFDAAHEPFETAVQAYERDVLPNKYATWRQNAPLETLQPMWLEPSTVQVSSQAGATFTRQTDGSWLATGKNGAHDTYTLTLDTDLPRITHLRLEALADMSMQHGGPGRAGNGNFALSKIYAEVRVDGQTAGTPLPFASAQATFEQVGLPVAAALDDNPASAWAVDPQFGRDHAAVFAFAAPVELPAKAALIVRLDFQCNTQHNIGRLRVSFTGEKEPPVNNERPFRETILQLVQQPFEQLAPAARAELLDWFKPQDAEWKAIDNRRTEHARLAPQPRVQKVLIASEGLTPVKLHTQAEQEFLPATHFLRRGDPNLKEGVAALGFLQVLTDRHGSPEPWQRLPPPGWRTSYQRTALAEWLTDVDRGAGSLLARVIVNRLWQHHLGRGLVTTPSDFGARGELPTHPELLDWLATELVRGGWDLKHLHRLIVTSAVYRQQHGPTGTDLDNRWLGRREPQRLEAEAIRDALLAATNTLDDRLYGPGRLDEANPRRSIYFTVKRSQLVPMLTVFDAPDGTSSLGERPQTTIAPQALILMNGERIRQAAATTAQQLMSGSSDDVPHLIGSAYGRLLQREPTAGELAEGVAFVTASAPQDRIAALTDFCQVLLCLNEFVYVD